MKPDVFDKTPFRLAILPGLAVSALFAIGASIGGPGPALAAERPVAVAAAATVGGEAPAGPQPAGPQKVRVGLYVTQLFDFDMARRSANIAFWAWFLHADDKYKPLDSVEIVNSKSVTIKYGSVEPRDGVPWEGRKTRIYWSQGKYYVTIAQDWDVVHFPFDRQVLQVQFEDSANDDSLTVFEADAENSRIDQAVRIPGWTIESFTVEAHPAVYQTTYGDPTLQGSSTYSRVVAAIVVKRDGMRLLCSMFSGFFVAFALTCLTYWLDIEMLGGARIGLCGGAIFASVGNKYVVDNFLSPASTFTLADAIEVSTFLTILLAALVVVVVMTLKPKRPVLALWVNRVCAAVNIIGYLGFNGVMIARATL